MPHFQKLYDKLKDRKDVVVVTFNLDENPGLIEPFIRENKYTFPVLPAKSMVEQILPQWSIPRNWIADPSGTVRMELIGMGSPDKYEASVVETIDKIASSKPMVAVKLDRPED